ncbi:MAG: thermonuclease family protein [bacterium]|nr:thermonuclease family protein [bacterium]
MYRYILAVVLGLALLVCGSVLDTWHQEDSLRPTQETTFTEVLPKETYPSIASVVVTSQPRQSYEVMRVVDGDTIDININGQTERLRLIGINTPETVDPRKPVECFGKEASEKARSILSGKRIVLESDPTQGERDK